MIYRREDIKVVRATWMPAIRALLETCRQFSNFGAGYMDANAGSEAKPIPPEAVTWIDEANFDAEPLGTVNRTSVMSVQFDVVDGEIWGILHLAAPLEHIDRFLEAFDEDKLLVFHNETGKERVPMWASLPVSGIAGMSAMPGVPPHVKLVFDPEDIVVVKEEK